MIQVSGDQHGITWPNPIKARQAEDPGPIAEPNARIKEIKLPSPFCSLYLLHVNVGQIPVNIITE